MQRKYLEEFKQENLKDNFAKELYKKAKKLNKKLTQIEDLGKKYPSINQSNKKEVEEKLSQRPLLAQTLEEVVNIFRLYVQEKGEVKPKEEPT